MVKIIFIATILIQLFCAIVFVTNLLGFNILGLDWELKYFIFLFTAFFGSFYVQSLLIPEDIDSHNTNS